MLQSHTRAIQVVARDVDDVRAELQAWIAGEADEPSAAEPLPPERFSSPAPRRELNRDDDDDDPPCGDLARLLEPDAFPIEPPPWPSAPTTSSRALRTTKDLANEVRAWCSMPPFDAWSRSSCLVLAILGLLAAGIMWGPGPADVRTLAAYMSESVTRFASLQVGR